MTYNIDGKILRKKGKFSLKTPFHPLKSPLFLLYTGMS
nr:MAG TPA: hypothetical protein [Caudoviricetes sp.]